MRKGERRRGSFFPRHRRQLHFGQSLFLPRVSGGDGRKSTHLYSHRLWNAIGNCDVRPGKKPAVVPFGFSATSRFSRSRVESDSRNVSSVKVWFHRGFGKLGPVSYPQAETRQHQALEAVLEIRR